jgi:hypothetical protein
MGRKSLEYASCMGYMSAVTYLYFLAVQLDWQGMRVKTLQANTGKPELAMRDGVQW